MLNISLVLLLFRSHTQQPTCLPPDHILNNYSSFFFSNYILINPFVFIYTSPISHTQQPAYLFVLLLSSITYSITYPSISPITYSITYSSSKFLDHILYNPLSFSFFNFKVNNLLVLLLPQSHTQQPAYLSVFLLL